MGGDLRGAVHGGARVGGDLRGRIGGVGVDDDELAHERHALDELTPETRDDVTDGRRLVAGGDDDADPLGHRRGQVGCDEVLVDMAVGLEPRAHGGPHQAPPASRIILRA